MQALLSVRTVFEIKSKENLKKSELVYVQYKNLKFPSILTRAVENLISINN